MERFDILVCPECHRALSQDDNKIKCSFCFKEWDIVDGVPHFANNEFYWSEISKEESSRLISISRKLGWRQGLEQVLKGEHPDIYEYIISDLRSEFKYLLPIANDSIVLDTGAGWGNISIGLSKVVKEVYAVELIPERVEFMNTRRTQEGIKNLTIIMADMMKPPLPSDFFDCVIVNGVLEWVGWYDTSKDPHALQSQFLNEMYRVLKPGGYIYIGIENRSGHGMFRGALDHSGLSYTSLMPRWFANLYCKLASGYAYRTDKRLGSYRTYTYTKWGYRKLLEDSRFSNIRFFMPLPSYNLPIEFVELKNKVIYYYIKNFIRGQHTFKGKAKKKLSLAAARMGIASFLSEDFGIMGQK